MRLNEKVPGYPHWPFIEAIDGKSEYVVHGDHASFAAYGWTTWLVDAVTHVGFFVTWYFIFTAKGLGQMVEIFAVYFFVYLPIVTIVPIPQLLSRYAYPSKDRVRFTRQGIVIRGKTYAILPNLSIQFRANRSPMSESAYQRLRSRFQADKLRRNTAYKLEFRQVEMIYSARIVPITSLADPGLAQQYALALQIAYDLINSRQNPAPAHSHSGEGKDAFPE